MAQVKVTISSQLSSIEHNLMSIHRSLNRVESLVLEVRSNILRRSRSNLRSPSRHSDPAIQPVPANHRQSRPRQAVQAVQYRTTRQRQLLQDIANRPIDNSICWYHRQFGIAANPANCPASCTFVPPSRNEIHPQRNANPPPRNENIQIPAAIPAVIPAPAPPAPANDVNMAAEDDLLNLSDSE